MVKGKRTLVTGAGGFVGRHLVRRLIEENSIVYALDRGNQKGLEEFRDKIKVILVDITNRKKLKEKIR